MNQLAKFKDDNGNEIQVTANDVKSVLCPNATDKEIAMFLALCQVQRLNPFIKDVYLIKYGNSPATMVTGKEVFTKRANANPDYEGFEAGVTFIDGNGVVQKREGSAVYKAAGEQLVGGWCRVFVKGRKPFYDEVTLEEYSTGKGNWARMAATMVRKVALVHCLREAFPNDFQGLYSQEEMNEAGELVARQEAATVEAEAVEVIEAEAVEMATTEQQKAVMDMCDQLAKMRGTTMAAVSNAVLTSATLKGLGYENPKDQLTSIQADAAIKVLDNWLNKATEAAAGEQPETLEPSEAYELLDKDIDF